MQNALERFVLTEYADRRPGALGGEHRQLVQYARASAVHPDILLLDDAFNDLSDGSIVGVADWMHQKLRHQQMAILMTSSRRDMLEAVASEVIDLESAA